MAGELKIVAKVGILTNYYKVIYFYDYFYNGKAKLWQRYSGKVIGAKV